MEFGKAKKGQYFSFDAIVATVIMVIAFTSLVAYWFGVQSVIEERNNMIYADSIRVADDLLSPGSPENWPALFASEDYSQVRQIGLTYGFTNALNRSKVEAFETYSNPVSSPATYSQIKSAMRVNGQLMNYYVVIEPTDPNNHDSFTIGKSYEGKGINASEVAVAHRGATLDGQPVRIRVFIWKE